MSLCAAPSIPVDNFVDTNSPQAPKASKNQGLGWAKRKDRKLGTLAKSTTYERY
jgi:hypothetical protein